MSAHHRVQTSLMHAGITETPRPPVPGPSGSSAGRSGGFFVVTAALPGCTGDYECPAPAHQHGCMSDTLGHCNEPGEHWKHPSTPAEGGA